MAILLFAEHDNAALSEQTAKALSAASQIGGDIDVLVAGNGVGAVAEQASKLAGIRSVLVAESDALANHLAENAANLIVSLAGDYDTIVAAATANGKNILPRVAALLDVMQVSEVMEVVDAETFKRPIYAGNAIEVVQSTDAKKVLTIRTSSFGAVETGDSVAEIKSIDAGSTNNGKSSFLENILSENDRPELGSAKIIVSGGRALGSEEKFKSVITPLADKLGRLWGRRAQLLMRATRQMIFRSVKRVKLLPRTYISHVAFPVRSSIWQA